jgi:hypothetical protein
MTLTVSHNTINVFNLEKCFAFHQTDGYWIEIMPVRKNND